MNIGERISELINRLGMNENSFAKSLGKKDNSAITRITKGRKQPDGSRKRDIPSADILWLICTTYGVDANWLLLGTGEPFPKPPVQSDIDPEEIQRRRAAEVRQAEFIRAQSQMIADLTEQVLKLEQQVATLQKQGQ
jgi:transcriptional regulator with XRE-family HTH domain